MAKILVTLLIGLMLTASGSAADRLADDAINADRLEDGIAAYERGDFSAALQLFQPLAERGDASAQCNLGLMYEQGRGVALQWHRMAAEQRNPEAQFNLGVMYEEGRGGAQDRVRAHMRFNLAAAISGDQNAKLAARNRDVITKNLTREQLFRAQEMAHQCEASSFKNCD